MLDSQSSMYTDVHVKKNKRPDTVHSVFQEPNFKMNVFILSRVSSFSCLSVVIIKDIFIITIIIQFSFLSVMHIKKEVNIDFQALIFILPNCRKLQKHSMPLFVFSLIGI